jgi:hypothetical protein
VLAEAAEEEVDGHVVVEGAVREKDGRPPCALRETRKDERELPASAEGRAEGRLGLDASARAGERGSVYRSAIRKKLEGEDGPCQRRRAGRVAVGSAAALRGD